MIGRLLSFVVGIFFLPKKVIQSRLKLIEEKLICKTKLAFKLETDEKRIFLLCLADNVEDNLMDRIRFDKAGNEDLLRSQRVCEMNFVF